MSLQKATQPKLKDRSKAIETKEREGAHEDKGKGAERKSSVTPQLHQNVRVIRGESEPNAGGTAYE